MGKCTLGGETAVLAELPVQRQDRHAPPDDVLDLMAPETWCESFWKASVDFLKPETRDKFVQCPPAAIYHDDLSWLEPFRWDRGRPVAMDLVSAVTNRWRALRACHGTRTDDVCGFYRHGLLPLDPHQVAERTKQVLQATHPDLDDRWFEEAVHSVGTRLDAGQVFLEANEEDLIATSGHYMLYGSEYGVAIAAALGGIGRIDYRQALKTTGRPTIFVCDIPLDLLSQHIIEELAANVAVIAFRQLVRHVDCFSDDRETMFGFPINQALPPSAIVGHYHPRNIPDPLLGFRRFG